jgi:hypothetical protein
VFGFQKDWTREKGYYRLGIVQRASWKTWERKKKTTCRGLSAGRPFGGELFTRNESPATAES